MREELIDKLDTMLIRTIADIDQEWGTSETGEEMKEEIRQAYQQIKKLIQVDVEEIIQAVLNHAECHHVPTHDEDGHHVTVEYDVDDKCHEAVQKVLGVGE